MKQATVKPPYERPSLKVLGTARDLTQGTTSGPYPDATFKLHTSPN